MKSEVNCVVCKVVCALRHHFLNGYMYWKMSGHIFVYGDYLDDGDIYFLLHTSPPLKYFEKVFLLNQKEINEFPF